MTNRRTLSGPRAAERGFALILAILALMLLTFLGLTLATTTSTELQIATNYRWSQQALYNAEAGLEAGRIVLSNVASPVTGWDAQLPTRRADAGGNPITWQAGAAPGTGDTPVGRDFYKDTCDTRGGVGYGRILTDVVNNIRYEDVSAFEGETLNGSFTLWVRRSLDVDTSGNFSDSDRNDALIIVSEGRAPYTGPETAFTAARRAVRVLETGFNLSLGDPGNPCSGNLAGQEGLSPTGENFNPCALGGPQALEAAFGTGITDATDSSTPSGLVE